MPESSSPTTTKCIASRSTAARDPRVVTEALVSSEGFAEERFGLRVVAARSPHQPESRLGFRDALSIPQRARELEGVLAERLGPVVIALVVGEDPVSTQRAGAVERRIR